MNLKSSRKWSVAILFLLSPNLEGAALEIPLTQLERTIVRMILTQGGRLYLQGDPSTPCQYAFVQEPRVAEAEGRLLITFLFSGRAGVEVAGRCVGAGDNFDIHVTGVPRFAEGDLFLDELEVTSPNSGYFRVVAPRIKGQMREKMRYPLKQELEDAAARMAITTGAARASFESLTVESIRVGPRTLRFAFDFELAFQP